MFLSLLIATLFVQAGKSLLDSQRWPRARIASEGAARMIAGLTRASWLQTGSLTGGFVRPASRTGGAARRASRSTSPSAVR
jgi:hypothetical protein